MELSKAIFKSEDGKTTLHCSKCGKVIKTGDQFSVLEKYALKGVITLVAQYCDDHKHMGMYSNEIMSEMVRKGIKEELRKKLSEVTMGKNVLNIEISRPNQKLVIMRGIPGSGKSTKANQLLDKGVIHSTDDLISSAGDYNEYFKKMVDSGDWSAHGRMHKQNFLNAKQSMLDGISPVIIDNTNIKASEPKKYVEAALKMGFDEANIIVVDVADGGVSAEVLAKRNTHNVPLKTIERMMSSHKGVGPLTVNKMLETTGSVKSPKVLYSGVMLDEKSKSRLLSVIGQYVPEGWKIFAHHMTISFGKPLEIREDIGKEIQLSAYEIGISDKAIAVKVKGYPSNNDIPHITVAVNVSEGGKPVMSNNITAWTSLDSPITVTGIVKEVMK